MVRILGNWLILVQILLFIVLNFVGNGGVEGQMENSIVPIVTTPLGQLQGLTSISREGKLYFSFHGIPYADPPKRFQSAKPVSPWEGVLDARTPRSVCPQMQESKVIGNENCLFLNVHFPHYDRCHGNSSGSALLPVIIFIHGGAYTIGSGNIPATFFMDGCVVLVMPNYRLGALGFMTTGDDVIPGNLGLKDQVLAFQWTQTYIDEFRGDPNLVTIAGMSAGGSSVGHHVASPMSKGLFHRAIAASGTALAPWSTQRDPLIYAKTLGHALNCPTVTSSSALKNCLESKDFATIIAKQDRGDGALVPFSPTIEPSTAASTFQTKHPAVYLRQGESNKVPFMVGVVQDEGISIFAGVILQQPWLTDLVNKDWDNTASLWFLYNQLNLTEEERVRVTSKIRSFYFGEKAIGLETRQNLTNLYSDRYFVQNAFETVELHSKFAPTYSYVITYKGGASIAAGAGYEIPAVTHGDDGYYLFGYYDYPFGSEQHNFSKTLVKHWINFAEYGMPNGPVDKGNWKITTGEANSLWHQLDVQEDNFEDYLEKRRQFWKKLGIYQHELF